METFETGSILVSTLLQSQNLAISSTVVTAPLVASFGSNSRSEEATKH